MIPKKYVDKEEFETKKSKLDIRKIISSFILKKEYFITHKKTNITDDYDIDPVALGEGAFGVVYKAKEKKTGITRAAKKIKVNDETDLDTFYREASALKTLDHPNIIKLYDIYENEDFVYLIEEF